jgi:hypothetical protein
MVGGRPESQAINCKAPSTECCDAGKGLLLLYPSVPFLDTLVFVKAWIRGGQPQHCD